MKPLEGKIAVVTGASRGVGKGVALGLGEAGATVYVTGRTMEEGHGPEGLPGTIQTTAAEVSALGGRGIALLCDHRDDKQTQAVLDRVAADSSRIDVLVNSVWGGYEGMIENGEFTWTQPFWKQPLWRWDAMFSAGARACYVASAIAARTMTKQRSGLIVNISFWARMTRDMAEELRAYNVSVVSLYPGLVRTEGVMRFAQFLDLSKLRIAAVRWVRGR